MGTSGSIRFTAVGSGDFSTAMASLVRFGEVRFTDFASFIENVASKANGRPIARLTVIAHGDDENIFFSDDDYLNRYTAEAFTPGLRRLSEHMAPGGAVEFKNCSVGNDPELLQYVADVLGVKVIAHTGASITAFVIPTGATVEIQPSARALHKVDEWKKRSTTG